MKVLVTGGLGFIGSHLVEALLKKNHKVTILDNQISNVVAKEFFQDKCKVILSSVQDFENNERFDQIYHLASIVGPAGILPYTGILGPSVISDVSKVCEWAHKYEAKLLYTSTSEVYGQAGCFSEEEPKIVSSKISSRSEYAVSKILAEIVMINRNKVSPFKFNIIRPFNIIGPRQSSKGGFVLPRFLESAYGEKSLSVFGSGSQIRAFTYIEDIVNALTMVMESDIEGEVFNIGNERNITTIKNLADIVKEETHARSEIIYVNPKEVYGALYEEAYDKLPNSSKIKKMLGWEPKYDLREAVQKTWGYFLEHKVS